MIRVTFLCFMVVASFCFFQLQSIAQQKHPCDIFLDSKLILNEKLCENNYKTADKRILHVIGRMYGSVLNNAKYNKDGYMIELGRGDSKKSILWYQKAVENGNDESAIYLGNLYKNGNEDIPKNYDESIYWFKKAFELNNSEAAYELAGFYYSGEGVIKNYNKSFNLFIKSVKLGNIDASKAISKMYIEGTAPYKDIFLGYMWLLISLKQNSNGNKYLLDNIKRDLIELENEIYVEAQKIAQNNAEICIESNYTDCEKK